VSGKTHVYMGGPELINVAYDTGCNLSCPSCNRLELPKLPRSQVAGFADSLSQLADDVRFIFLAGMGDPFGTPHYYEWLCNVDIGRFKRLKEIILNTNGLLWNERTWNAIPAATRAMIDTAVISIDGASRETFEVNRYPAKWGELVANLEFIASLRRRGELKVLRTYFVYQANNYHEMPSMVDFCRRHAFDVVFFARIANWLGIPQAEYDALDVVNPRHRAHQDYLRVAARTSAMTQPDLQVVVMR
jgi:MoaA/NifB/PqqE/SkfB family radical SAM enzyme